MHSSIAESLYERMLSSYPPGRAYTQSDWDRGPMPGPVRHFLVHLLQHQCRHESQRLRRAGSDWIDYEAQEVQGALSSMQDVLSRHARVPDGEWKSALQQATRYVTAYLFRPAPVLADFVFGKQAESLPLDRIRWRMQFFRSYSYLANAVNAYAERQSMSSFERDAFRRFLHQIDQRLTSDYSHDQWMDLLQPMLDLTQAATGTAEIPIQQIRPFFADKGHEMAVHRLDQLAADGQSRIGASGLYRVLKPERTTDERAPEAEPLRSDSPTWDDDNVSSSSEPDGDEPTPLWKRFQQGSTAPSGNGSSGDSASKGAGKPLWAQYRTAGRNRRAPSPDLRSPFSSGSGVTGTDETGADAPEAVPGFSPMPTDAQDLSRSPFGNSAPGAEQTGSPASQSPPSDDKASIEALEQKVFGGSNPPQRGIFVRQLFGGDLENYHQVLRRLQHANSWSEASQIIARDVFRAHKVNIYSDAAVQFTNAVENRFR
jgi:hypothetical protein